MKTYVHGTSYENAMNIIKNGFTDEKKNTIWSCSDPGMIYVRDADNEDTKHCCIECGQITAAKEDSKSDKIALIKIEIPDKIAYELAEDDISCPGMDDCYQIDIKALNEYIIQGKINLSVDVYKDAYIPCLMPFYLCNLSDEYLQVEDPVLYMVLNEIKKQENPNIFDLIHDVGQHDTSYNVYINDIPQYQTEKETEDLEM